LKENEEDNKKIKISMEDKISDEMIKMLIGYEDIDRG
jgi:hypothetical protein